MEDESYNPRDIDYYVAEFRDHTGTWGDEQMVEVIHTFIERAHADNRTVDWGSIEILYDDEVDKWYGRVMLWPDGM